MSSALLEFNCRPCRTSCSTGTRSWSEQTLDRLVTPDFTQRINGRVYRRSECAAHVREMRRLVAGGGEMRVLEQVHAGESIAGRYLFRLVSADGQETISESHLFARPRDGRVARFVEVAP